MNCFLFQAIYHTDNAYLNADALMLFYPEAVKYYWRADAIAHDTNDKRAIVLKFEFAILEFVIERNRKRERSSTAKP